MTIAVEVSTNPMPATNATARRKARHDADAGQHRARDDHLQRAEPEDLLPEAPEPLRLHLEPDDEEEHHDAELGRVEDGLGIAHEPQHRRPDQDAAREVAQHRAEPQPLEDRHGDDPCPKQRHHREKIKTRRCRLARHPPVPVDRASVRVRERTSS